MNDPDTIDMFDVAEDAFRYTGAIRAGEPAHGRISFDHTVMVMCDSATRPVRWYHLVAKHGRRKQTRVRCYKCGKMATMVDVDELP